MNCQFPISRYFGAMLGFLIFALSCSAGAAHNDIKLGLANAFSGPLGTIGKQTRAGAQIAIDEINAKGGLNGRKIKPIFSDDQCYPDKAAAAAKTLVAAAVVAVIGHDCGGAANSAKAVYDQAHVPQISPAVSNPNFTQVDSQFALRLALRDDLEGKYLGNLIASKWHDKSILVINDESAYGSSLANQVATELRGNGEKVTVGLTYNPDKPDYKGLATTLNNAGADVVFVGGYWPEVAQLVKTLRSAGSSMVIIGGSALQAEEFAAVAKNANNVYFASSPDLSLLPNAKTVTETLKKRHISSWQYAYRSYAAVQVWFAAAEATGTTDGATILKWLKAGNAVSTVLGEIKFTSEGDLSQENFQLYGFSGRKFVALEK